MIGLLRRVDVRAARWRFVVLVIAALIGAAVVLVEAAMWLWLLSPPSSSSDLVARSMLSPESRDCREAGPVLVPPCCRAAVIGVSA